jgi:hypothetical protein
VVGFTDVHQNLSQSSARDSGACQQRGHQGDSEHGCETHTNMSQLDIQLDTMTSDSISPDITSTIAIPAIDAKDSTVNVAGRDLIFITNNYTVDPNFDQGIWTNQLAAQTHHLFRQNLSVVVRCHPICKL